MSDPHQPMFPLPSRGADAAEPYRYPVIGQAPQPPTPPRRPMPRPSRGVVIVGVVGVLTMVVAIVAVMAVRHFVKSDEEKAAETTDALTVLATIPVGPGPHGVVLDEDAQIAYVANMHGDSISVIDLTSQTEVAVIEGVDEPRSLAIDTAAGRLFATGWTGAAVSVIDTATRTVLQPISTDLSSWLAVDPTRGVLWVAGGKDVGSVQTFDTATGSPLFTVAVPVDTNGVAVDADGGVAYVSMGFNDDVALWVLDAETGEVRQRIGLPSAGEIAISGAGTVATAQFDEVYFLDPEYAVTAMELPHRLFNVAYDRSTGMLFGTSAYENLVAVVDPSSATVVKTIAMDNPEDIAVDSERHTLYVTNNKSGTLTVVGPAPN